MRKAMIVALASILLLASWQAAAHSIVSPRDPQGNVVSPRDPASGLLQLVLHGVFA